MKKIALVLLIALCNLFSEEVLQNGLNGYSGQDDCTWGGWVNHPINMAKQSSYQNEGVLIAWEGC